MSSSEQHQLPDTTRDAILQNAHYHNTLMSALSEIERAGLPSVAQHTAYMDGLEQQIKRSANKITNMRFMTSMRKWEYETMRDSTTKRLAARVRGRKAKYEEQKAKGERDYLEALQSENDEEDKKHALEQLLAEARTERYDVEENEKKCDAIKKALNSLYARIFDGPSPSFPDEDQLEYAMLEAQKKEGENQQNIANESAAVDLLARACTALEHCLANMSDAQTYSQYDIHGGDRTADYKERTALTLAHTEACRAEDLVDQAIRVCLNVQPVGRVDIPAKTRGLLSTESTNLSFHQTVKAAADQVVSVSKKVKEECKSAMRRRDAASKDAVESARQLELRRAELSSMRAAIVERVVAGQARPPSYDVAMEGHPVEMTTPVSSAT